MSKQLDSLKPPTRLNYSFAKRGTLEAPFTDTVALNLARTDKGRCCKASGDFLTAERRMPLPEVDDAEGNPVILYFLEHDIREMNRLTKGSTNYFRKRIRMALFEGATLRDVSASYRGKPGGGQGNRHPSFRRRPEPCPLRAVHPEAIRVRAVRRRATARWCRFAAAPSLRALPPR